MREDVEFQSEGTTIRAWHYPPTSEALSGETGAPAVILGHGLAMTRDCGLEPHAERFAAAGVHVILFDYRGFGASDGSPRDVVKVRNQVKDYLAAIAFARQMPEVDPARVALWGTSYSGGCVVDTAARDGRIRAVIAQCPNLDNLATGAYLARHTPIGRQIWLVISTIRDVIRGLLGREPFYIQATGRTGERASYVSNESCDILDRLAGPTWNNRFGPRDFASIRPYRPIRQIKNLPCRIQIMACDRDDLTPVSPTLRAAKIAGPNGELHRYPVNHFGIYVDETMRDALDKQTAFLERELAPGSVASAGSAANKTEVTA